MKILEINRDTHTAISITAFVCERWSIKRGHFEAEISAQQRKDSQSDAAAHI